MKKYLLIILVIAMALSFSIAAHSQINSEIQELFGDEEAIDVIVILKDDYNVLSKYEISNYNYKDDFEMKRLMIEEQQENVLEDLKLKKDEIGVAVQSSEDYDFELTNAYSTINGFAGKLRKSSYEKLRNNPNVLEIVKSGIKSFALEESVPLVNATNVWRLIYNNANVTGKWETVCVIDSGIDYTHQSLGNCTIESFLGGNCSKVLAGYDFKNDDNNPIDDQGHGTHVSGIIASTDKTNRGVAPDAALVALKVCDNTAEGNCEDDDIIAAIDWCVNNASRFNISVISMSLGAGLFSTHCDDVSTESALKVAIDNVVSRNISVIVAAGNDKSKTDIASPACLKNSTAVTSSTKSDDISSFSNRNNITDLVAPGTAIKSTVPTGGCVNCHPSGFKSLSGTSMSTPHAAGAFALLRQYRRLEQNSILMPLEIQDALNDTGVQIDDTGGGGSGFFFSRINILAALLSLDKIPPNISFVEPTPINNSNFTINSTSYIVVNITSNEVLSSSIIELSNSTAKNISMSINGLNSFINLTSLRIGVRTFRAYGIDFAGNIKTTELRTLQINNTAPTIISFAPSSENVSISELNNQTFSINFSDRENDEVTFSWYLNNTLQINSINKSGFNFTGNLTASGFYIVNVTLNDGAVSTYLSWNFEVNNSNAAPILTSVNLTNTDFLNRTNGTLQAFWGFVDLDEDNIVLNETLLYINGSFATIYTNKTFIHPVNTTKLENWTFSVRGFDSKEWSEFANSSTIKIENSKPSLNLNTTPIELNETQKVNISLSASDLDDDNLNYTINDSNFLRKGDSFIWTTTLSDAGSYSINLTANDSIDIDSMIINITILDALDSDGDGNPDFNDTDNDNDGINDTEDKLFGNSSHINTSTINPVIEIGNSTDLKKNFNGTNFIKIRNNNKTLVEFSYNFSLGTLDLRNISIDIQVNNTNGITIFNIKGTPIVGTKTLYVENLNNLTTLCIKDAEIASITQISSLCNSADEFGIKCPGTANNDKYNCTFTDNTNTTFNITGLIHSGIQQQSFCGDGIVNSGESCSNCPADAGSCPSPSPSGGGGSGSGGGGGGGGIAGFVCNMDWQCGEWSACINGQQTRQCNLVKVPQHFQIESCHEQSKAPISSQACKVQQQLVLAAETCEDGIQNQNEQNIDCGGICKPCEQSNLTTQLTEQKEVIEIKEMLRQPIGFAIKDIVANNKAIVNAVAYSAIIALITVLGIRLYRRQKR